MYLNFVDNRIGRIQEYYMAMSELRRKKKKNKWVGWHDVSLNKKDKEALTEWCTDEDAFDEYVTRLVVEGYRFSIGWDSKRSCVVAHLTGEYTRQNVGLSMSARAKTPSQALRCVLYKHIVKLKGSQWVAEDEDDSDYYD